MQDEDDWLPPSIKPGCCKTLFGTLFFMCTYLFTSHRTDVLHLPGLALEKRPISPHHQSQAERPVLHPASQAQHMMQATKLSLLVFHGPGQIKSGQPIRP